MEKKLLEATKEEFGAVRVGGLSLEHAAAIHRPFDAEIEEIL
jgi:hypothetical protein